ncbi:IclR family transcriptional regulator [Bacillus sp. Marseille-P3661]|uniref:IclR family transcriptional regulator n=1 Tax=Bacillus sp. Marseille-P3661 TaxID=1936234 RepID=UPI000C8555B3|nr:IclR family transcriptional regulator [Bacillus sp. Marseille-P3661]
MDDRKSKVQSVERTMKILECFTMEKPELTLSELTKKTGLNKSTIFRLLATLMDMNYIRQDSITQKYSLGFKFFHLGSVAVGNLELRSIALPFMRKLSEETSETISLNIADGNERVCIEIVESPLAIRNFSKVGQRNSLWVGASGKVLLAYLDESERKKIISYAESNNLLKKDAATLVQELEKILYKGYENSANERVEGSYAVVAPIFGYSGDLLGVITAACPVQRLSEERIPILIQQVVETASKISEEMGFIKS